MAAGPLLTVRLTAEPAATDVPAAGLELMTLPEATVLLLAVVTVPTVRLAPVIAELAAAWVRPITFGTGTGAAPVLTVRLTAEPAATLVPAAGFELITLPNATVALLAIVTVPTVRPAPVIAVSAAAWVIPTTFGTLGCGGRVLTVIATAEPGASLVAADGVSLMTVPEATEALLACVTVPSVRPAAVSAEVASACDSPTTFGTLTVAGAWDVWPQPMASTAAAMTRIAPANR